jgi:hypothetical protein
MTNNITYILGAGASCKALPLVSDMKPRMQILLDILNPKNTLNRGFKTLIGESCNTQLLFDKYNAIIKEANKHYTPDTYAKKLWLTGKTNELIIFKEFLNLYFIFEQDNSLSPFGAILEKIEWLGKSSQDKAAIIKKLELKKTLIEEMWDKITTPIDYRYDVFFATLLQGDPDNLTLPPNLNVISWNYDNQFELAYKEYTKYNKMHEIQNVLGINTSYNNNRSNICKINGFCDNWDEEKDIEISFIVAIEKLIKNESFGDTIGFGWEEESINELAITEILENTDILIIIGYSFPNFNRDIDDILISSFTYYSERKIVIQVPGEKEFIKIKSRIMGINGDLHENCFIHIDDKDQFYIPM